VEQSIDTASPVTPHTAITAKEDPILIQQLTRAYLVLHCYRTVLIVSTHHFVSSANKVTTSQQPTTLVLLAQCPSKDAKDVLPIFYVSHVRWATISQVLLAYHAPSTARSATPQPAQLAQYLIPITHLRHHALLAILISSAAKSVLTQHFAIDAATAITLTVILAQAVQFQSEDALTVIPQRYALAAWMDIIFLLLGVNYAQ